jgi:hypothetical protein
VIARIQKVWETYEHHQKLIDAPHYSKVLDSAKPLSVGEFQIQHIPVDVDPTAAVTAPITEFGYLKTKEGKDKECLDILRASQEAMSTSKGVHLPAAWGEIMENAGQYLALVGWESLEVCVCPKMHQANDRMNAGSCGGCCG